MKIDRLGKKVIRINEKINDILLLKTIAKYLASIVGNPVSIRSITDYSYQTEERFLRIPSVTM